MPLARPLRITLKRKIKKRTNQKEQLIFDVFALMVNDLCDVCMYVGDVCANACDVFHCEKSLCFIVSGESFFGLFIPLSAPWPT